MKWFHGEKDDEKNVIEKKNFEKHSVCVQFAVRKWLWRIVHLKNQAGEHEGE